MIQKYIWSDIGAKGSPIPIVQLNYFDWIYDFY